MWAVFLAELLADYGSTQQVFAEAIGVSRATVSHWLRTDRAAAPPGIDVCLRIAVVTRTSASDVLRAAGKDHVVVLLEQLYGGPARVRTVDPTVSATDRRILAQLAALDPKTRRAFLQVLAHVGHE